MPVLPQRQAPELRAVVERLAAENLRPLAVGLGIYYAALCVSHLRFLSPPVAGQMAGVAGVSVLILGAIYFAARAGKLADKAHLVIVGMASIAMGNSLAHLGLTADPKQTSNVAIVIVGCGLLFYSRRWMYAFLAISVALWLLIARSWPPEAPWVHSLFMLVSTSTLAILAFQMRMRALQSMESMKAAVHCAELEARLQQMQKAESLGVLASGVAHDLNNVLVGVLGNADLARRSLPQQSDALPYLDALTEAGERAADLARQMLDYSGKGRMVTEPVQMQELMNGLDRFIRASCGRGIRLESRIIGAIPPLEGDPSQLRQVLLNLLLNAAEAIGERPGVILLRVEAIHAAGFSERPVQGGVAPPGEYIQIKVRDDGCGIDAATRERMFDPFYTTKHTGRGLGLATVSGVVRAHKGVIIVDSKPGQGTCVTVCLPAAAEAKIEDKPVQLAAVPSGATILVVDDEAAVRWVAREALRGAGYRVLEAKNGLEALHQMRNPAETIDLVLLDATMPVMGGLEVLQEVDASSAPRTVLMSGYGEDVAESGAGRIHSFLRKPFSATDVLDTVRATLAQAGSSSNS